ncbi:MAG: hypothetical protein M1269_13445 [Chloroflexi bacterium]|nr:hypothetical protein [Chloroflexota bacterium]
MKKIFILIVLGALILTFFSAVIAANNAAGSSAGSDDESIFVPVSDLLDPQDISPSVDIEPYEGKAGSIVFDLPEGVLVKVKSPKDEVGVYKEVPGSPPELKSPLMNEYLIWVVMPEKDAPMMGTLAVKKEKDNISAVLAWPLDKEKQQFSAEGAGRALRIKIELPITTEEAFTTALTMIQDGSEEYNDIAALLIYAASHNKVQDEAFFYLGSIYSKLGRPDLAYDYFQQECQYNNRFTVYSYLNLAMLDGENQDWGKGIIHYQFAYSSDPDYKKYFDEMPSKDPGEGKDLEGKITQALWYESLGPKAFEKGYEILDGLKADFIQKNGLDESYLLSAD